MRQIIHSFDEVCLALKLTKLTHLVCFSFTSSPSSLNLPKSLLASNIILATTDKIHSVIEMRTVTPREMDGAAVVGFGSLKIMFR